MERTTLWKQLKAQTPFLDGSDMEFEEKRVRDHSSLCSLGKEESGVSIYEVAGTTGAWVCGDQMHVWTRQV
jgi:hypothetical protein